MTHLEAFRKEVHSHVQQVVDRVLDTLAKTADPSQQPFSDFQPASSRLIQRLDGEVTKALKSNGFQRSIASPGYYIPYTHLLPKDFDPGTTNLIELANNPTIGRKRVPHDLVANVLQTWHNDFMVPQNKFAPFNCQKISCLYFGTPASMISGDLARGVPMGHLWNCLTPAAQGTTPYSMFSEKSYTPPETVEFDLVQALLTGRKSATFSKPLRLDEALYYDSPQNNLCSPGEERYTMCGSMFRCAKQLSEAWNAMISALHNHPAEGTLAWNHMQPYLYTPDEVKQVLAAMSAVVHANYEQAEQDAELFYPGRMRAGNFKDPRLQQLQRHVCHLQSAEDMDRARALYQDISTNNPTSCVVEPALAPNQFSSAPMQNNTQQPAFEKFNIRDTCDFHSGFWQQAKDVKLVLKKGRTKRKNA